MEIRRWQKCRLIKLFTPERKERSRSSFNPKTKKAAPKSKDEDIDQRPVHNNKKRKEKASPQQ